MIKIMHLPVLALNLTLILVAIVELSQGTSNTALMLALVAYCSVSTFDCAVEIIKSIGDE